MTCHSEMLVVGQATDVAEPSVVTMELRGCGGLLRSSLWFAVVLRCAVLFSWSIPVDGTETGTESWITTGAFEHIDSVRSVSCNRQKSDLGSLKISNYNNTSPLILLKISQTIECKTSSTFTSCMVDDEDATVTALITDLTVGETRVYECVATYLLDTTQILKASVNVTFNDVTTAQPSTTVSTQSGPGLDNGLTDSASTAANAGGGVSSTAVIVGLIVLVILIITCGVLIVLQCRGRRRNRSRDSSDIISRRGSTGVTKICDKDCMSLSATSMGGFSTIPRRHSCTSRDPPSCMAPDAPGGNRYVMQYQKPLPLKGGGVPCTDDKGYGSESASAHYQEPWGRMDDEIIDRLGSLRPNPRMCKVPGFDVTSAEAKLNSMEDNT